MKLSKTEMAAVMDASARLEAARIVRAPTRDGMFTFDSQTVDSAGAFLVGELERLDQTLHGPLAAVTWSRDIDLREDVSIADETSSFTNSSFAAAGGPSATGKSWIGKTANAIQSLALDIGKTATPLSLWAIELGWTIPELKSAQQVGRPVDQQKYAGMQLKWNMDIDEQVYVGDELLGLQGLVNSSRISNTSNAVTGNWDTATRQQVLDDVDEILTSSWEASGYTVCPSKLLLPPKKYSKLVRTVVSDAGNISLLEFLKTNSIANSLNGQPLDIQPLKWLPGRGASNKDRMVAYTQDQQRVRFPLVPLQRTPLEFRSIYQLTTYFGRLGAVEFVYPETVAYRDGI